MTRTRSSSPGRTAGFTALASELMFMTRTPCSSATRLRLKSLVRIDPAAALARAPRAWRPPRRRLGHVVLDDLDRRAGLLLHPGQDLQAAPAAVAAQRVGAVGDVLELVEDEARHDQRAVDEPGLDDLGDPAVDDRAGVDDDPRLARPAGSRPRARRAPDRGRPPRRRPAGRRAWRRSGRPSRGRGRATRRAAATSQRRRQAATAASPSSRPIRRPRGGRRPRSRTRRSTAPRRAGSARSPARP